MTITSLPKRRSPRLLIALFLIAAPLSWAAAAQGLYHVLAKGETLYSVARQYGLKPDVIAKANSIDDPSKLKAGTRLLIPGRDDAIASSGDRSAEKTTASAPPAAATTHTVAKGDTLFSIARTYGVGLDELRAANKFGSSSKIKPGDTLRIPVKAGIPPNRADPSTPILSTVPTTGSGASTAASDDASGISSTVPGKVIPSKGSTVPKGQAVEGTEKPSDPIIPDPVKTSVKSIKKHITWPCPGEILYLEGKAYGVIIKSKQDEIQRAVTAGTVSSAGPYRGYGNVVFVLSRTGHIYVYGGNDRLSVRAGDRVTVGQELGRVGMDLKQGGPAAYFLVFKNGVAVDPAQAPRD